MEDPVPAKTETPTDETPKRGPGAPKGSANGARHFLIGGKLPPKMQYIEHRSNAFRRHLEEAVILAKGEVSITDAAAINSATKWERHAMLALSWLRKEADKMSVSDRLRFSEAIAKASDSRDKNIRLLGLDVERNIWEVIVPGNGNGSTTHDE